MSRREFEILKRNKFINQKNYRLYLREKSRREKQKYSLTAVTICFVLGIILMLFAIALKSVETVEYTYANYVIQQGDTLYSIARESNLDKQLNEIAWILSKDNNVQAANLKIGQEILIRNEVK